MTGLYFAWKLSKVSHKQCYQDLLYLPQNAFKPFGQLSMLSLVPGLDGEKAYMPSNQPYAIQSGINESYSLFCFCALSLPINQNDLRHFHLPRLSPGARGHRWAIYATVATQCQRAAHPSRAVTSMCLRLRSGHGLSHIGQDRLNHNAASGMLDEIRMCSLSAS